MSWGEAMLCAVKWHMSMPEPLMGLKDITKTANEFYRLKPTPELPIGSREEDLFDTSQDEKDNLPTDSQLEGDIDFSDIPF